MRCLSHTDFFCPKMHSISGDGNTVVINDSRGTFYKMPLLDTRNDTATSRVTRISYLPHDCELVGAAVSNGEVFHEDAV